MICSGARPLSASCELLLGQQPGEAVGSLLRRSPHRDRSVDGLLRLRAHGVLSGPRAGPRTPARPTGFAAVPARQHEPIGNPDLTQKTGQTLPAHGRDTQGRRLSRPPSPYEPPDLPAGKINTTDLDSRNVKTPRSYTQGYNVQAVVNEQQIVLAAEVTLSSPDFGQLEPRSQQPCES